MTDTSPEAVAAVEQSNRRQHFTDVRHVTVRWEPYKPDGARQMKAKGRWQEQVGSGDYWRWQNCKRPAFAHDPDMPDRIEQLEARLEAVARAALEAAAQAVHDAWMDGVPVAEIAFAIRALDPAQIVKEMKDE